MPGRPDFEGGRNLGLRLAAPLVLTLVLSSCAGWAFGGGGGTAPPAPLSYTEIFHCVARAPGEPAVLTFDVFREVWRDGVPGTIEVRWELMEGSGLLLPMGHEATSYDYDEQRVEEVRGRFYNDIEGGRVLGRAGFVGFPGQTVIGATLYQNGRDIARDTCTFGVHTDTVCRSLDLVLEPQEIRLFTRGYRTDLSVQMPGLSWTRGFDEPVEPEFAFTGPEEVVANLEYAATRVEGPAYGQHWNILFQPSRQFTPGTYELTLEITVQGRTCRVVLPTEVRSV